MSEFTHFIGIDISKKHIDLALLDDQGAFLGSFKIKNTSATILEKLQQIGQAHDFDLDATFFCLEATGLYGNPFLIAAVQLQVTVGMEPAWKMQSNRHHRGKTDQTDAIRIGDFACKFHRQIRPWQPEPQILQQLRYLIRTREQLVEAAKALRMPMQEAKQMEAQIEYQTRKSLAIPVLEVIEQQIKTAESQIAQLIKETPKLDRQYKLICSIPGIGMHTALQLILLTRGFTRFENARQLACYGGVAPFEHQSGSSIRGKTRVSHKANKRLKKALHMAALSAIQNNADIKAYFARKVAQGKNKMSVINAIRNKLLQRVFAVLKRGTPYINTRPTKDNFVA